MRQFDIILHSFGQVQEFEKLATTQPFEVLVGNERQTINGKDYLLMAPIHADFAVIAGYQIDKAGNVWYKGDTSNFNIVMATAADVVIAEAEEVVELGVIAPENVRTSGVFVDYVVEGGKY